MVVCSNALREPPPAERIGVVRLGALGDVARTLPAVASLRRLYPRARITWLVEPSAAGVLDLARDVDDVVVFPRTELVGSLRRGRPDEVIARLGAFLRGWRGRRLDLVIDFHGILKSGALAWLSGAPVRVGYARPFAREGAQRFVTLRADIGSARRSRFERNAGLVAFLADGASPGARPGAGAPAASLDAVRDALGPGPVGVLLHPGTSAGAAHKRWPPERFGAIAGPLAEQAGAPCLVVSGPSAEEGALADAVVAAAGGAARRAPATASVADLAALLSVAPLFVGADSGPLHLAAILGTPVVQILGPTDPVENAPYAATPARSVRVPVPCSPCRRGCGAPICIEGVTAQHVLDAARELLAERDREAPPWRAA